MLFLHIAHLKLLHQLLANLGFDESLVVVLSYQVHEIDRNLLLLLIKLVHPRWRQSRLLRGHRLLHFLLLGIALLRQLHFGLHVHLD